MSTTSIDSLVTAIRKLETKVPSINGNNDFWKGYKEAIGDLWNEIEKVDTSVK
jgi:hypothetical protein